MASGMVSSFLSGFDGYWRRPPGDYRTAIETYTIVLDTNVLLELYRFTKGARSELITILEGLRERLWIPHHVASEYYANRADAIKGHLRLYSSVPEELNSVKNKALGDLAMFARRCSLSDSERDKITTPLINAFEAVNAIISEHAEEFDLTLESVVREDPVLQALARILDGRVGDPLDDAELPTLLEEYKRRAEARIPPGYRDAHKSENAYGDYLIWEQVLRKAESSGGRGVLLVTQDAKEDWVRQEVGFTVGARPELIAEMKTRAQADFLITHLGMFLKTAKDALGSPVSDSTVAQAENAATVTPEAHEIEFSGIMYTKVIDAMRNVVAREEDDLATLTAQMRNHPEGSLERGVLFQRVQSAQASVRAARSDLAAIEGSVRKSLKPGWVITRTTNEFLLQRVMGMISTIESEEISQRRNLDNGEDEPGGREEARAKNYRGGSVDRLLLLLSAHFDDVSVVSVSPDSATLTVREVSEEGANSLHGIARSFDMDIALIDARGVVHRAWARR